ncbi:HYR domain-containing protein [Aestuariivivens sediminis]|uniref:HYR domain-containing protein n=1 Tax=Aestuariivivens sediminis TaxID=2913557 RepID=UPI001F56CE54|nr:HYR domain-containing protein [Aestuariivivens sediminis]
MKKRYFNKFLYTLSALLFCLPLLANNIYLIRTAATTNHTNYPYYGILSDYAQLLVSKNLENKLDRTATIFLPPTVICQDITVYLDATGSVTIAEDAVNNGSFGNGPLIFDTDITTFTCADIGINPVVLTVTDNDGSNTCNATVTVEDNVAPIISGCPSDFSQNNDAANCSAVVTWTEPTAADNCTASGSLNWSKSHNPGDVFPVGTTTVTYSATDAAGNTSALCTFDITVVDNEAPIISGCPSDFSQNNDAANCSAVVTWTEPTAADNCTASGSLNWSKSHNPGDVFPVGTTTVTYSATDAAGNTSALCTFDITVVDNEAPIISGCPSNITLDNAPGQCGNTATWTPPTASDNCSFTLSNNYSPGDTFNVGTTTVTYTATDPAGNTDSCSFTVTIIDNELPIAVCQDISIDLDADGEVKPNRKLFPDDIDGGSSDNCNFNLAFANGFNGQFDCSDVGVNIITLVVTDASGNQSMCDAQVTVVDANTPPVAVCKDITVQLDATGNATITGMDIDNGSSDLCGIASYTATPNTFDCSNIGTNNVVLTVTDYSGNTATCNATVTVEDKVKPTVSCQPFTLELDDSGEGTIDIDDIALSLPYDACGIANTVISKTFFDCSDLGDNSVRITVTDNYGNGSFCDAIVTVEDNIPPVVPSLSDINWGCAYEPDTPTATDNCTGGTIDGVPDASFPITTTTTITWTFTDNASNSSTTTQLITINQISCTASETKAVSCNGGSDGEATVDVTGGIGPFTYLWSNGQTTQNATGLPAGSHSVTVTDSNGCSTSCSVTITEPTPLGASITGQSNTLFCYDSPEGWVTAAGSGGVTPYTYRIDAGAFQSNATFSNQIGGTHTITVQDANGCTADVVVNLTGPSEALIADVQLTDANCFEPGSKGVVVTGQGGNGGYEYQMTGDASVSWTADGDFGGLLDGTYYFQVRDSEDCVSENVEVVINESTRVKVEIPSWENALCYGEASGSASGVVSGGKAPYTYLWDDPAAQTTLAATGLAAGTYTLTVTDFYNCPVTATVTITEPDDLIISESHEDVTCYNGTDGSITLSVSGGVGPYLYSKNGGVTTSNNTFLNLTDGTYTMSVIDANGCEKEIDVVITESSEITASFTTNTVGCAQTNSGTATVTPTGGVGPYTYLWSNGQTGQTATGLSPATYNVTITDASGCSATKSVTYSDPALLDVSLIATVTSGVGQTDGTASATPSGGVGPYTYSWTTSDGSGLNPTAQNQTGLSQGTYTVTVTDSKGCQKTESIVVADIITIVLDYEAACDPTLSVDLQRLYIRLLDENSNPLITGGYGDLTYNWNFGANVKNDVDYTPPPTTTVNDNSSLEIAYTLGGNKTIVLTVTDDSGQTVNYSFNILIGSCIEFDVECDRCVSQDYQLLDWYIGEGDGTPLGTCDNPGEIIDHPIYIWFYLDHGDNTNYNLNVVAEYTTVHPLTGEISTQAVEECLYKGVKIGTGAAYLFIDDQYVCGSQITITKFLISWTKLAKTPCGQREPKCFCPGFDLEVSSPLSAIATATDISCYAGTNNGTATVEAFGGTPPYTYLWTTSDGIGLDPTAQNQTGLSPGTYTVTVTDSNTYYDEDLEMTVSDPYTFTTSVTVGEPPELSIISFDPNVPPCYGSSNGYAQVNATGGTEPYTYAWSNGQTTQTATNLGAGTYTVIVTDANGCTDSDSVTLTDPPLLTASATSTEPLCYGDSNGTALVTPAGGTPGYTYLWSDGQTTQQASGLASGSYSVTVTDANNCTATASVTIGQPNALAASTSKTNVNCYGAGDGTATITVTYGTPPYTYLWSDSQTNQTAINLSPGTYNVVATDANGCQISRNVTITQPTDLTLSTEFQEPQCYQGANGGTAKIYPSGGTAPYSYLWSDGQTTQTANNLAVGTYTVTVTDAKNCTETASIEVTQPLETVANAGPDQDLSVENCGITSTVLAASGQNSEGTPLPGSWYIASGTGGSFSDITDPNAIFTGQAGNTYQLLWEIDCDQDLVIITFGEGCNTLDFDGDNDHVTFQNEYNLSGAFSFEIWVKPDPNQNDGGANNAIQTIFSKRDATTLTDGYDLRLQGTSLSFNYNGGGTITASNALGTNRWYHIAVTFDGSNYILYVDGIQVGSGSGAVPTTNTHEFMLGAMDQNPAGGNPNPVNYYSGWMQELRVWDVALTKEQIRQMMNQTIINNGTATRGMVVPIDVDGLNWSSLVGYYRMLQPASLSGTGYLLSTFGIGPDGQLRNIETTQQETAPLPYETDEAGNWNAVNTSGNDAASPWEWGHTVWDYPNSTGINGDPIDWNIVRTGHDVTSDAQDVTLLGLLVDAAELTITNSTGTQDETNPGHALNITHYLKLDGLIDLIGESQLVQKRYTPAQVSESILDSGSSGHLERDQQGQSNLYNYNYWSSPVSPTYNSSYNIASVLNDGTDTNNPLTLQWTSGYNANPNTSPITMSRRWLWAFKNNPINRYANWEYLQETGSLTPGLGYTMKGSGAVGDEQNYVFDGLPHNGTITTPISFGNEALVGNPYPSAIDAREFIQDNIPGGNPGTSSSFDGALYFWVHYDTNNTHILRDYQGGYASLNLIGGNPAVAPLITIDGYEISGLGSSNKIPDYFVPVGQGFFVYAVESGSGSGDVTFHNRHRIFKTEQGGESVFMKQNNSKGKSSAATQNNNQDTTDDIQRVRLLFRTPEGAKRHLLLGFTPDNAATDGFDFGYDAINRENHPNDMLFRIDDKNYMIQGVGAFDETKQYPLAIFSETGGPIEIHLTALENLPANTKVYVYDALLGSYTKINSKEYEITLDQGEYLDRFFITFTKNNALSVNDELMQQIGINYLQKSKDIYVKVNNDMSVKQVQLINILGQTIKTWDTTTMDSFSNDMKIPVRHVPEGSYIVKVITDMGTANKKIVINQ